ncbi:glutathione peroxidase [Alteromonadales bacterium alter-6D02]|nr:glutathione peroxidase [Alteromonadales bacterium alter-6D02]
MAHTIYEYSPVLLSGEVQSLSQFQGQVLLIVNTASECGFTYQYQGLERLYQQLKGQGFTVLGFPCNQFGEQEPGDSNSIASFCQANYGVTFPMFHKVDVNGEQAEPLFTFLKEQARGLLFTKRIKWNFTKFLVNQQGLVIRRYSPTTKPQTIEKDIKALLEKQ